MNLLTIHIRTSFCSELVIMSMKWILSQDFMGIPHGISEIVTIYTMNTKPYNKTSQPIDFSSSVV